MRVKKFKRVGKIVKKTYFCKKTYNRLWQLGQESFVIIHQKTLK